MAPAPTACQAWLAGCQGNALAPARPALPTSFYPKATGSVLTDRIFEVKNDKYWKIDYESSLPSESKF